MKHVLPLLLASMVTVAAGCRRDAGEVAPRPPVLLVTHPTKRVLQAFNALVRNKILDLPRLRVVGLYHAQERHDYRPARAYLKGHALRNFSLRRLTCPIGEREIWRDNACSATFRDLVDRAAGIVFTGGTDLPPALYGHETRLSTEIHDPRRHTWEISLLVHLLGGDPPGGAGGRPHPPLLARRPDLPVLAICLGLQQMNVAAGGTLTQALHADLYGAESFEAILALPPEQWHRNPHRFLDPARGVASATFHPIRFKGAGDPWRAMLPSTARSGAPPTIQVVSSHHQAVNRLGRDLEVIATSMDGKVVEALRHRRFRSVLGVQFHPEYNALWVPSVQARSRAGHRVRNAFFSGLAVAPETRAFHLGFWRLFGGWLRR